MLRRCSATQETNECLKGGSGEETHPQRHHDGAELKDRSTTMAGQEKRHAEDGAQDTNHGE